MSSSSDKGTQQFPHKNYENPDSKGHLDAMKKQEETKTRVVGRKEDGVVREQGTEKNREVQEEGKVKGGSRHRYM